MAVCSSRVTVEPPANVNVGTSLGLFSAVAPQTAPNGQWELCGIQHESNGLCAKPEGWTYVCPPEVPEDKNSTTGFETLEGDPFTIILGIKCALVGHTLEEFRDRVRESYLACVETSVERAFWTGSEGNDPHLASTDAVIIGSGLTEPYTLTGGLAALESYLGENLCGPALLHAPQGIAEFAQRSQLIVDPGTTRMRTALNNRWVFGGGYASNTGPNGAVAPQGVAWIYATGQVNMWRSEVFINPEDLRYAFDRRTNDVEMFAEQTFAFTRECLTAAVAVRIGCDC